MTAALPALCARCIEALHMEAMPKVPLVRPQPCESCGDDAFLVFDSMPLFEKPADLCKTRGFHVAPMLSPACRTCGARAPLRLVPKTRETSSALSVAEAPKRKAKS